MLILARYIWPGEPTQSQSSPTVSVEAFGRKPERDLGIQGQKRAEKWVNGAPGGARAIDVCPPISTDVTVGFQRKHRTPRTIQHT